MMFSPYCVHEVRMPNSTPQIRYVIMNTETGEMVDDANGYGYTSIEKARNAWNYKTDPARLYRVEQRNKVIERWCDEHWQFMQTMDFFAKAIFDDQKPDTEFVQAMLTNNGYTDLPFTTKELRRYWQECSTLY